MRSCRNHSTVLYGRKGTTLTSYLHRQTFQKCVRSLFSIQSPYTQHRQICISVNPVIVAQPTTFRRRYNLKKSDWEGFSANLDSNIEEVDAIPENYERFVEILRMASRKHIPGGCRSNYTSGLTNKSKSLYEAYKKQ